MEIEVEKRFGKVHAKWHRPLPAGNEAYAKGIGLLLVFIGLGMVFLGSSIDATSGYGRYESIDADAVATKALLSSLGSIIGIIGAIFAAAGMIVDELRKSAFATAARHENLSEKVSIAKAEIAEEKAAKKQKK